MPLEPLQPLQTVLENAFATLGTARKAFSPTLKTREVGHITSIVAGIAKVSGLPGIGFEEVMKFPGGIEGIAFNVGR